MLLTFTHTQHELILCPFISTVKSDNEWVEENKDVYIDSKSDNEWVEENKDVYIDSKSDNKWVEENKDV